MTVGIDYTQFPILVVDDEADNLDAFRFNFRKEFSVVTAQSGAEALERLAERRIFVVVADQRMPQMTGIELLQTIQAQGSRPVSIILTAYTDVEVLVEAINSGTVHRYLTKPWNPREMRTVLRQAIEHAHLLEENQRLQEQLAAYASQLAFEDHSAFDFGAIVGESAALADVLKRVEQVAATISTVLLRGETGTGKEMVARAIHINSDRANAPFVAVNCAALPSELLESELFGHEKGAFTGAVAVRKGRFELADRGTIFLDEIGDLPGNVQVKLLRVLQEREFERVGSSEPIKVDTRVISATNRDLEQLVAEQRFREDLYYRLNVFPIDLPPLRDRERDVLLLAEHFLERFASRNRRAPLSLSQEAGAALMTHDWPGNVRELQNVIERAAIVAPGLELSANQLDFGRRPVKGAPGSLGSPGASGGSGPGQKPLRARLADQERDSILRAIEGSDGNIAAAARALGINRSTLYFRIKKHGLEHLLPMQFGGEV